MITLVWICVAIISSASAFYFWRQYAGLREVLVEGSRGLNESNRRLQSLEKMLAKNEAELVEVKSKDAIHRTHISTLQASAAKAQIDHNLQVANLERKLKDTENQRNHIEKTHLEFLDKGQDDSVRLAELQERFHALDTQHKALELQHRSALDHAKSVAFTQDSESRTTLKKLEKELKLYKNYIGPNPRDFDTLRRKVNQYETLYQGMKGLRDMAEERNKNWEIALKELSTWVLKSNPPGGTGLKDETILQSGIGPIVGEALKRIGAELIDDDFMVDAASQADQMMRDLELSTGDQTPDANQQTNEKPLNPLKHGASRDVTTNAP